MEYNFQGFIARVLEFPIDVMLHFFLFVFYSSLYAEPSTFQIFYYAEPSQSVASFICNSVQRVSLFCFYTYLPILFFSGTLMKGALVIATDPCSPRSYSLDLP